MGDLLVLANIAHHGKLRALALHALHALLRQPRTHNHLGASSSSNEHLRGLKLGTSGGDSELVGWTYFLC